MNRLLPVTSPYLAPNITTQTSRWIVIAGETQTCKTSLMFQGAVSGVSEGEDVTYICRAPFSQMPLPVHGMPTPDPSLLRQLRILYMEKVEELIGYLAGIHQVAPLPQTIIVDDLHHYTLQLQEGGAEHAVAKLCALLVDAATYMESKSPTPCHLLLSTGESNKHMLNIYNKFIPQVATLKDVDNTGGSGRKLELRTFTPEQIIGREFEKILFSQQKDAIFLDSVIKGTYLEPDKPHTIGDGQYVHTTE